MKRPSVDPAFTFAIALALSLVLWYPTLRLALNGEVEITDAGIRYFLALAISWAGVYGICALVAMYAGQPRNAPKPPSPAVDQPARRATDPPVAAAAEADATDGTAA